jgi:hypothetical protein
MQNKRVLFHVRILNCAARQLAILGHIEELKARSIRWTRGADLERSVALSPPVVPRSVTRMSSRRMRAVELVFQGNYTAAQVPEPQVNRGRPGAAVSCV